MHTVESSEDPGDKRPNEFLAPNVLVGCELNTEWSKRCAELGGCRAGRDHLLVIGVSDDPPRSRSGLRGFGNVRRPPIVKMLGTQIQSSRTVSVTPTTTHSIFHPRIPSPLGSPSFPRSALRFPFSMLHSYSAQLDLSTDAAKVAVRLQSTQSFVASAHELRAAVRNSSPAQLQTHAKKVGEFPWLVQEGPVTPNMSR